MRIYMQVGLGTCHYPPFYTRLWSEVGSLSPPDSCCGTWESCLASLVPGVCICNRGIITEDDQKEEQAPGGPRHTRRAGLGQVTLGALYGTPAIDATSTAHGHRVGRG